MTTRSVFASSFVALAAALLAAPPAHADGDCRAADGPFTSTLVPPPTCASPVGLCTHGILTDDLPATYDFTFATLVPAPDADHPNRYFYTGKSVITADRGGAQMFSDDHGYIDLDPTGLAPFVTTVMIQSGTGRWQGRTGVIVASGNLDFSTGDAVGSYAGALCR
jgi:hypothetical protein